MSKDLNRQLMKLVEKFGKTAEKEMKVRQEFFEKASKLATLLESDLTASQFVDRLKQKGNQLSDDLSWANLAKEDGKKISDESGKKKAKAKK